MIIGSDVNCGVRYRCKVCGKIASYEYPTSMETHCIYCGAIGHLIIIPVGNIQTIVLNTPEEIELLMGLLTINPNELGAFLPTVLPKDKAQRLEELNNTVGKLLWKTLEKYSEIIVT